mmetsp:Transcript_32735/g.76473  ORF Transcript_32735/g.76473 Transcript_32735/m.76473 type:complete len:326 (-) Transcript_32735:102-1079(-)
MKPSSSKSVFSASVAKAIFMLHLERSETARSPRINSCCTSARSSSDSQAAVSKRRPRCGVKGTPTKSLGQCQISYLRDASIQSASSQNSPSLCSFRYIGTAPTSWKPERGLSLHASRKRGCHPRDKLTQPLSSRPERNWCSRNGESSCDKSSFHKVGGRHAPRPCSSWMDTEFSESSSSSSRHCFNASRRRRKSRRSIEWLTRIRSSVLEIPFCSTSFSVSINRVSTWASRSRRSLKFLATYGPSPSANISLMPFCPATASKASSPPARRLMLTLQLGLLDELVVFKAEGAKTMLPRSIHWPVVEARGRSPRTPDRTGRSWATLC